MDGKKPSKRTKKDASNANEKKQGKQAAQKAENQASVAADNPQQSMPQQTPVCAINHQQQMPQQQPDCGVPISQLTDDIRHLLADTAEHYIGRNTTLEVALMNPLFRLFSQDIVGYFVEIFYQMFQQQIEPIAAAIRHAEALAVARQRKRSLESQDSAVLASMQQYRQIPRNSIFNGARPRGYLPSQNSLPHSPTLAKRTPVPGTPPGLAFRKPGQQAGGPVYNDANRPGPQGVFNMKQNLPGPLFNDRQRIGGPVYNDVRQHSSLPSNLQSSPQAQQTGVANLPSDFDPFELDGLQAPPVQQNGGMADDPLAFAMGGGSGQETSNDVDPFTWANSTAHQNQLDSALDVGQDDMPPTPAAMLQSPSLMRLVQQRQRMQVRPS